MKRSILISTVAAATLFLSACSDNSQESAATKTEVVSQQQSAVGSKMQEGTDTSSITDGIQEVTKSVQQTTEELGDKAVSKLQEAKEEVVNASELVQEKVVDTAKDAKEQIVNTATSIKDSVEDTADKLISTDTQGNAKARTSTATAEKTDSNDMPDAYKKCVGCHGKDGKKKALNKSAIIASQDKQTLISSLNAYKDGTRNVSGMGMVMKGNVVGLSDADLEAIAIYLSNIK